MPPRKRQISPAVSEEKGYLKFNLTEDDRGEIRLWATTADELWEKIAQLLDSQYQFKVAYDKNNDCYACYISGHWVLNKPDANWTLTGRGSSWEKAVRQALWVHFEHFGGDWQQAKRSNPVAKDWD